MKKGTKDNNSKEVYKMRYIKKLSIGFILLLALALSGCQMLHEDISDCDLFLKFRYDYNLSYDDWFGEHVKEVKVFIFDENDRFVEVLEQTAPTITSPGYKMDIPYQYKGYSAIVWAGKTEPDYQLSKLHVGDKMESLFLRYTPADGVSTHHIEPLWHSGPHKLVFPEADGKEQTVSLVRNTNDFQISLRPRGTATSLSACNVTIKGANGCYDHRNLFPSGNSTISYGSASHNQPIVNIYAMRMVKDTPLLLSAKDEKSGRTITFSGSQELNLTEILLKNKPGGMEEQEYLDRKYIWEITLNYDSSNYLAISISVNNWTYWFYDQEL